MNGQTNPLKWTHEGYHYAITTSFDNRVGVVRVLEGRRDLDAMEILVFTPLSDAKWMSFHQWSRMMFMEAFDTMPSAPTDPEHYHE